MLVTMLHQQRAIPVDQQDTSRSVVNHQGTVHGRTRLNDPGEPYCIQGAASIDQRLHNVPELDY